LILWSWERVLSAESEEIWHTHQATYEKSYDTCTWVELQRWVSTLMGGKVLFVWYLKGQYFNMKKIVVWLSMLASIVNRYYCQGKT